MIIPINQHINSIYNHVNEAIVWLTINNGCQSELLDDNFICNPDKWINAPIFNKIRIQIKWSPCSQAWNFIVGILKAVAVAPASPPVAAIPPVASIDPDIATVSVAVAPLPTAEVVHPAAPHTPPPVPVQGSQLPVIPSFHFITQESMISSLAFFHWSVLVLP